jgi:2-polyprenyl-3-methyl-5-hydroxy-6-metoxy-1,4-benzoquinol methylase
LRGKRVLDIGCSDGLYLKNLSKESVGIEQVSELSAACKKSGLNVINGDVEETVAKITDNSFDAVLFSHVMEHIDSPISMLRQIHRILVPRGRLILGLPIERNIYRDLLGMDYFDGTHIYAFSVRNAIKLLNVTGFQKKAIYFHLPKCRSLVGHAIESLWNSKHWPFR